MFFCHCGEGRNRARQCEATAEPIVKTKFYALMLKSPIPACAGMTKPCQSNSFVKRYFFVFDDFTLDTYLTKSYIVLFHVK